MGGVLVDWWTSLEREGHTGDTFSADGVGIYAWENIINSS